MATNYMANKLTKKRNVYVSLLLPNTDGLPEVCAGDDDRVDIPVAS